MTNYVLVHGGYAGISSFGEVPELLGAAGHKVVVATLPGLGTRQEELHPGIILSDHIAAVEEQIAEAEFERFILVGHSYGGAVITGLASKLAKRIDAICYIDAFMPQDGECLWDFFDAGERQWYINNQKYKPGLVDPIRSKNFQVVPDILGYQPILTFMEAVKLSGDEKAIPKKTYILAKGWRAPSPFPRFAEKVKTADDWDYHEVECNHFVMEKMPEFTANTLLALAE